MLLAWHKACFDFLAGLRGCHCPHCWMRGILYRPCSSLAPMSIGWHLHVISTSCSLCTVTPCLVKIDTVPASAVLPTLMSECGKSSNVSASVSVVGMPGMGNVVTWCPRLMPPLATPTHLVDLRRIGNLAWARSRSLIYSVHRPQSHM